ncbi:putative plant self-incompatibility S1 [Helianthus annuus]|nr:putative plant self-incompatibility S1 [Helianthus annuus]
MSIFYIMKSCSLFIALTYFSCFLVTPSHSQCFLSRHWSVYMYNGIPNSQIDVHVRSGDDDLGHHNITIDLGYKFSFCESIFDNTLFVGDFIDNSRSAHFHVFDRSIGEIIHCSIGGHADVYWLLKEDGYYLSREFKSDINDPTWMFRGNWE